MLFAGLGCEPPAKADLGCSLGLEQGESVQEGAVPLSEPPETLPVSEHGSVVVAAA